MIQSPGVVSLGLLRLEFNAFTEALAAFGCAQRAVYTFGETGWGHRCTCLLDGARLLEAHRV